MSHLYNGLSCQVAILAPFHRKRMRPLGKQTTLIAAFFAAADRKNIACGIFQPDDLQECGDTCSGVMFRDGKWVDASFRRPDVIYDRYYSSISGFDPRIQRMKRRLEERFLFLNPVALAEAVTDKQVFSELMASAGLMSPRTHSFAGCSRDEIIMIIGGGGNRIIKPRFGRMGRSIIRFGGRAGHYTGSRNGSLCRMKSADELFGFLTGVIRDSGLDWSHFIIQDDIPIHLFHGRVFDIRVLVQRSRGDCPASVTGSVVRIGITGASAPNLDRGGIVMAVGDVLREVSGKAAGKIAASIRKTALDAYRKMEDVFGPVGELGIDIILDRRYRPWIIEMNAKPGRIAFQRMAAGFGLPAETRKYYHHIRKVSIMNPIVYGAWLSERKRGAGKEKR